MDIQLIYDLGKDAQWLEMMAHFIDLPDASVKFDKDGAMRMRYISGRISELLGYIDTEESHAH